MFPGLIENGCSFPPFVSGNVEARACFNHVQLLLLPWNLSNSHTTHLATWELYSQFHNHKVYISNLMEVRHPTVQHSRKKLCRSFLRSSRYTSALVDDQDNRNVAGRTTVPHRSRALNRPPADVRPGVNLRTGIGPTLLGHRFGVVIPRDPGHQRRSPLSNVHRAYARESWL